MAEARSSILSTGVTSRASHGSLVLRGLVIATSTDTYFTREPIFSLNVQYVVCKVLSMYFTTTHLPKCWISVNKMMAPVTMFDQSDSEQMNLLSDGVSHWTPSSFKEETCE